jgi:hypothetical protein
MLRPADHTEKVPHAAECFSGHVQSLGYLNEEPSREAVVFSRFAVPVNS